MKRMQCEICGSNEIKKIDDSIFECQSCGVQYSKDEAQKLLVEITGEVKIDHSTDVENLLVRANQFLDEMDYEKAFEYFNKVLDFDPNNSQAQNGVLLAKQSLADQYNDSITVLKPVISFEKAQRKFFESLGGLDEITPNIYKDLEIISTKQCYVPFKMMDKQVTGSYDGVACYRKQVPYTDYETKTDYSNKNQDGTYKKVQVAVTKYREEIERQPVNGTVIVGSTKVITLNDEFAKKITPLSPNQYDSIISNDEYSEESIGTMYQSKYNDAVLHAIELYLTTEYDNLKQQMEKSNPDEVDKIYGISLFDEYDSSWISRGESIIKEELENKLRDKINTSIPGDFNENVTYRWYESYNDEEVMYIPMHIIEYAHGGKFYISVMPLCQDKIQITSYPRNMETKSVKKEASKNVSEIKKQPLPTGYILGVMFSIVPVGTLIALLFDREDLSTGEVFGFLIASLIIGIPTLIGILSWYKKKRNDMQQEERLHTEKIKKIELDCRTELAKEKNAFFKALIAIDNIEEAVKAAKEASQYSVERSNIKGCILLINVNRNYVAKNNNKSTTDASKSNDLEKKYGEIVSGFKYSLYITDSGTNKIEVIKTIREKCNLGLATAKDIVETPNSLIASGLEAENVKSLFKCLTSIGASVSVKKEK